MKLHSHRKVLLAVPVLGLGLLFAAGVFADSTSTTFEAFNTGTVDGQYGWEMNGPHDQEVVTGGLDEDFGTKALRVSDATTSGGFSDWIYASPVLNGAGEADATVTSPFTIGDRQTHFEASFDLMSADPDSVQGGLHLSVSPDQGNGGRMSFLLFEDTFNGIDVTFADVQGGEADADFAYTQIATNLDGSVPHNFTFVIDFVEGPSNDVVEIWLDNVLVHTGTSWEDYYRFIEGGAGFPPIVKTLLFQSRTGAYVPANQPEHLGKGFLIDNVNIESSEPPIEPPETSTTITLNRIAFGVPGPCQNVLIDSTPYCVSQGDPEEVEVAAGGHTVSFPGGTATIVCFSDGSFSGYAPFSSSPSVAVDLDEGDSANCIIYSIGSPQ